MLQGDDQSKIPDSKMEEDLKGKRRASSFCYIFSETTTELSHLFLFGP